MRIRSRTQLLVAFMLVVFVISGWCKVKNGYEAGLPMMMLSLENLRKMLDENHELTSFQRRNVMRKLNWVIEHISYHHITDSLLRSFKTIAPDIYQEMDTLTDASGKPVDIYIKYAPSPRGLLRGTSSFVAPAAALNSGQAANSVESVSIRIYQLNSALQTLSHEFGHVSYVIPNLRSYLSFYKATYRHREAHIVLGHAVGDLSGKNALKYEKHFRIRFGEYVARKDSPAKTLLAGREP